MSVSAWSEILGVELGVKRMNIVTEFGIRALIGLRCRTPVGSGCDWEGQNGGCNCRDGVCQKNLFLPNQVA